MRLPKFLSCLSSAREVPQWECPNDLPIVATKLPKLQGIEERENMNCGNQVAKNGRKKKVVTEIWGGIKKKKKKCYVHNIFTTISQQITGDQLLLVQI